MGSVVENEHGTYTRDPRSGAWRRVNPSEQLQINKSSSEVFGESFINNFQQFGNLLQAGLAPLVGDSGGAIRNFEAGLAGLASRGAEQQERGRFNEQATVAGTAASIVLDPLNLAIPGVGGAARTVSQRVASKIAGRTATEEIAAPALKRLATAENTGSLGADNSTTPAGLRSLLDLIFEEGTLTPQQTALIPAGERIGFKFLPGQKTGNRQFLDSLQSHPITAQAFAHELGSNADLLRNLLVKALDVPGVEAGNFTREILRLSKQAVGGRFNSVREAVENSGKRIGLADDEAALINETSGALTPRQRTKINLADMDGKQAFEIRSRLNSRMADLYKNGEGTAAKDIESVIESLDSQIGNAVGDGMVETWRTARQQWRVRLAIKKPGVITPDGDVSLKRLSGNLEKMFEREFGETLLPDQAFRTANPAIADLMDFTRVSRSFASNLPDSGTATRQTVGRILAGDWKELASATMLRKLIEATAK